MASASYGPHRIRLSELQPTGMYSQRRLPFKNGLLGERWKLAHDAVLSDGSRWCCTSACHHLLQHLYTQHACLDLADLPDRATADILRHKARETPGENWWNMTLNNYPFQVRAKIAGNLLVHAAVCFLGASFVSIYV